MSAAPARAPVGRLAPSPTGFLHVGHARSFLLAWWHARSRGGRIVLRVEDLDVGRVREGAYEACLRDLEWLGLDWDAGPARQSDETAALSDALDRLLSGGRAYACVCSRRDVRAASAPHASDGELRYPGTCRGRWADLGEAERESGGAAGVRFAVEPGPVRFRDELSGEHAVDVAAEVGDFLIARRDGVVAYQLAVVVDDARQGVDEIVRGDDLVGSTPRQVLLQRALGLPHPRWWHVPLVVGDDGERLAKRKGALALAELREAGVDARALVAWVARSAGVDAGARIDAAAVSSAFAIERIPREPVRFGAAERAAVLAARARG